MDVLSLRQKRKPSDNWAASDRMFNPLCHILQMSADHIGVLHLLRPHFRMLVVETIHTLFRLLLTYPLVFVTR